MSNDKVPYSLGGDIDYSTKDLVPVCQLPVKTLQDQVFTLTRALLPSNMFDPTGHLYPDSVIAFGNLGFIEFLDVREEIAEETKLIDLCPQQQAVKSTASIKKISIIVTIGYSVVLYNAYENHSTTNSDAILATQTNFTTLKIDGFAYSSIYADTSKFYDKNNYTLNFDLTATPDIYAPQTIPFVGVISSGNVTLSLINP
jgi:hypothetical protein